MYTKMPRGKKTLVFSKICTKCERIEQSIPQS